MDTKVEVQETGEVSRQLNFEVASEIYDREFDIILSRAASEVRLKGFRPGRAPKDVVAKMYGKALHGDVLSTIIESAYRDAVREHSLMVVGDPKFDVDEYERGDALTFRAEVELFPEPDITDYFGVSFEVEVEPETTSDEEVQKFLSELREQHSTTEKVTDRTVVEATDTVVVDYVAQVEGKLIDGGKADDAVFELSGDGVPEEFRVALVGGELGSSHVVTVPFPEDMQDPNLAGKTAEYSVELKEIREKIVPELNDDFAKSTKLAETVDGLRDYITESRAKHVRGANERATQSRYFETLLEKNVFEVPSPLVNEEIRALLFELGALNRHDEESYKVDVSAYREALEKPATFRVRRFIALEVIIKKEGLEVSEGEIDGWFKRQAEESDRQVEDLKLAFGYPDNSEAVQNIVKRDLMTQTLLDKAVVKRIEKSKDEEVSLEKSG